MGKFAKKNDNMKILEILEIKLNKTTNAYKIN